LRASFRVGTTTETVGIGVRLRCACGRDR
jgi:hypothetical protein